MNKFSTEYNLTHALKFLIDADRRARMNLLDLYDLLEISEPTLEEAIANPL